MLAMAALLLAGCTFSDSLRVNEVRSVWGPSGHKRPPETVFFVTDRESDGAGGFTLHWGGEPHCGRADVAISDASHMPAPDPALQPVACDNDAMETFARTVADTARARGCDRVLLIVHGYNVSFRSALLHGAQVAMDAGWPCATVLFNWSSEAKFDRYAADIERSGYAVPLLLSLMRGLAATEMKTDILAHSMGSRITLNVLSALCPQAAPVIGQLVLAAPDVGAEQYNDDFGRLLKRDTLCIGRTTIYASDNDMALIASESIHGGIPRAGRLPERDLQYGGPGIDVIDASLAPGDPAGHAYVVFSYEMLTDIMWVLNGAPLAARAQGVPHTLDCADRDGSLCAAGGGRYSLVVAPDRRPGLGQRLIRHLWPLILPLQ